MHARYHIYRQAGAWACEYRNARGRVVLRRKGMPTIDAAMAEVDEMRKAPVLVVALPRATTQMSVAAT